MKLSILALSLASVGCGPIAAPCYLPDGSEVRCGLVVDHSKLVDAPARADEAIQAVADAYGLTTLPSVYWYGAGPDCGTGYVGTYGGCFAGESLDGVVTLVVPPDDVAISDFQDTNGCASLAHEMAHYASEQAGEGGCDNHACRWFKGPCQAATAKLSDMGL